MARFNTKSVGKTKTTNLAGGEAYSQSPELELVSILLTSFTKDTYYESAEDNLTRLENLVQKVDPLFAAKAAVYARNEFGMRSITHVMAGALAKRASGKPWARSFYNKIVRRPDDMLEITSYYFGKGNKRLSSAMQNGFRKAFEKFDAYQLAKYRGENRDIKLIDMVRLVRPSKTSPNIKAIGDLVRGTLKSTGTWEAKLTVAGQKAQSAEEKAEMKRETWIGLVEERKFGYFALLRNLRNIKTQAPEIVDSACEMLTDRKLIKKSLVMPFRFLTAMNEIPTSDPVGRKINAAIRKAFEISMDNIPDMPNTLVVVDNSGSMSNEWGSNRKHFGAWSHAEIGAMFGMMLAKRSNADIMEFGSTARMLSYNDSTDVFNFAKSFEKMNKVGHGTNFQAIFSTAKRKYDRIVIFSDMQGWMGGTTPSTADYKRRTGADPYIYSFDLAGYGSMQFPENKVFALAGFSEKVFDIMSNLEQDPRALLSEIEKVELI
jgi:60 kDa SS-A/Ro ribonucleoprotein